jgi:signal transduction histidine kinase
LNTIDNRITLLSNTIDDFRYFYNTDNKKSEFDLSNTINQAIEVLTPAIKDADLTLQFKDSLKSSVTSLESEIIQVLMNIIKNAIDILKEKEQKREIFVNAYQDSEHAYIVVEDNAGGVSDEIIDKIFDPYFSTKKEKHGMGLGLYMSKLIIQEHCNGTLEVHNSDEGAVFTITLPLEH